MKQMTFGCRKNRPSESLDVSCREWFAVKYPWVVLCAEDVMHALGITDRLRRRMRIRLDTKPHRGWMRIQCCGRSYTLYAPDKYDTRIHLGRLDYKTACMLSRAYPEIWDLYTDTYIKAEAI